MEFQAYPKWKYHSKKDAVIVANEAEEKALGRGWADTPAAFDAPADATPEAPADATPEAPADATPEAPAEQ